MGGHDGVVWGNGLRGVYRNKKLALVDYVIEKTDQRRENADFINFGKHLDKDRERQLYVDWGLMTLDILGPWLSQRAGFFEAYFGIDEVEK